MKQMALFGWSLYLLSLICNFLFYLNHPSSPDLSFDTIKSKFLNWKRDPNIETEAKDTEASAGTEMTPLINITPNVMFNYGG